MHARAPDRPMGRLAAEVPELALNVHLELRLPNTLNIRSPRAAGESALAGAPEIGASTGSPCHEGHEMRQR